MRFSVDHRTVIRPILALDDEGHLIATQLPLKTQFVSFVDRFPLIDGDECQYYDRYLVWPGQISSLWKCSK